MKLLTKNDSYKFLGDLLYNSKAKDIENDIKQLIPQKQKLQNGNNSSVDDPSSLSSSSSNHNSEGPLTKEEIIVIVRRVTMGMGSRNPIERVITYQLEKLKLIGKISCIFRFDRNIEGKFFSFSGNFLFKTWK